MSYRDEGLDPINTDVRVTPPYNERTQGQRKAIPPEHQAILDRKLAPNGLAYRPITCQSCGHHIVDEGVLLGVIRKKCPVCKFPNVQEINRVGEPELLEFVAKQRADTPATPAGLYEEARQEGKVRGKAPLINNN